MSLRALAVTVAVTAAGAVLATPATADPLPPSCTWTAHQVQPPVGYSARYTTVAGTDSHGTWSGVALTELGRSPVVVTWTADNEPKVISELNNFSWPSVADENSAGTILVSGSRTGGGGPGVTLYGTRDGARTDLTPPAGYVFDNAVALNERGDVLARGHGKDDNRPVSLYWSNLAAAPIVVDSPYGTGTDLDDDGTILLDDKSGNPAHLWRHGETTALPGNAPLNFEAIRAGKVVGYQPLEEFPKGQALLWDGGPAPRQIDGGGSAWAINATGLVAGIRDSIYGTYGKPAIWQGTTFVADLPLPSGAARENFVVGDDNSVFVSTSTGPVRWTCS
jgi:hypothetical protein